MTPFDNLVEHNRRAWDALAHANHPLTVPVTADEVRSARQILDPVGWLPRELSGKRVLALAAGGGRFSTLFAALGCETTVVDISEVMLARDRESAQRHRLSVRCIQADMCRLDMLPDGDFDLVMQPVSTPYVADPRYVFAEVARVLRLGGVYVSFHKQPMNLQTSLEPRGGDYVVEHPVGAAIPNPVGGRSRLREAGTIEHAHPLELILGGICRSGFVITDCVEPQHGDGKATPGSFGHRCRYVSPYLAIRALRVPSRDGRADVASTS